MEATAKKAKFLEQLVDTLELDGVDVLTGRAETLAHDVRLRERFDVVASRAVAKLDVLAELTLPFCRDGGLVVAQKARGAEQEIEDAEPAIASLGGKLGSVMPITVPESDVPAAPGHDRQADSDAIPVPETAGDSVEAPPVTLAAGGA